MSCITKLFNQSPEIHNYLRSKTGIDYNEKTGEGKQEWIKAAKELQDHSVDTIYNVYSSVGVKGFEKTKPVESNTENKVSEPDEIKVSELIDKPITYKGEKATLIQDGQTVVAKIDGKNKEYELGNIDEVKDHPISDYGIGHETSVVSVTDNGNIKVREGEFKNNYSNPLAAINHDKEGNVVSVNLETADGKKRTFRGNIAEDIAYQIHLKEINKNNETRNEFEDFINTDNSTTKEINDSQLSETSTDKATENNAEVSREKAIPISTPQIEIKQPTTETKNEPNQETNIENKQADKQTEATQPSIETVNKDFQTEENKPVDEGGAPPIITPVDIEAVKNNDPTTGITHEQTNEIANQLGFNEYEEKPEKVAEWDSEADKRIKEDPNTLPKLIDKMQKGGMPDKVEQRIMAKYVATLKAEIEKNPTNEKIAQMRKVIDLSNIAGGREVGKSLVARKGAFDINDSLAGYFMTEMDANLDAPLTKVQTETVQKEYADISAKDAAYKEKIAALEAENAKLKADNELKKNSKKAESKSTVKKTHEDYVSERDKLKEKLKAQKEKREQYLKDKGIHTAGPSFTLTGEMAKTIGEIVKSHVEEIGNKLAEVTKRTFEDVKDLFEGITEKDIHDVIAGKYNEKQKTKSEVAENLFNLKKEAELINKLERLQNGTEPKNERKKIKRNQEIESLQKQIKDYKKEESEASKFYGENDVIEKRIQAKEDELKRLKERRDKEPEEKNKKEISEREQKLNEEIEKERKAFNKEKPDQKRILETLKTKNANALKEVEAELKTGNFAEKEKKIPLIYDTELKRKFPQLYADALKSQNDLIKAKQERQLRLAIQEYNNRSKYEKTKDQAIRLLNVPRTLMASMDYSAPLRQAVVVTVSHPIMAAKAGLEMFKSSFSQQRFDNWSNALKESDRYQLMNDSGLSLTDPHSLHLQVQEEAFMGNIAEKIPVIGGLVKGSERAYVSYLNKMRADLFNKYTDLFESRGRTFQNSPELYKGIASYVNNATGRGNLGFAESAAPILNSFLFSPRLIASRMNMLGIGDITSLGQGFYGKLPPEIRVQAAKDMATFIAAGIGVLALAKYGFGAQTETDPRSADFGKIKQGDTRWDIWGGFQPFVRVIAQVLTAERKSTTQGKIIPLEGKGSKFGSSRADPLVSFGRGKLAPIPSMVWDALSRRTVQGNKILFQWGGKHKDNEITLQDEAVQHFLPLIYSDVQQAIKDNGIKSLFTVGIPSTFGVGTQTYQKK